MNVEPRNWTQDDYERYKAVADQHERILVEARKRHPAWAELERKAEERVKAAIANWDVDGGARAMADWIDARCLMIVYSQMKATIVQ